MLNALLTLANFLCALLCRWDIKWVSVSDEVLAKAMGEIRSTPSLPHIHKVGAPPKQTLFQEFKHSVVETFFPDKPFDKFKYQNRSRKFPIGLQSVFPIFEWGRDYDLKKFRGDFVAGLTLASLCIPQVTSYFSMILLVYLYILKDIGMGNIFSNKLSNALFYSLSYIWNLCFFT